MLTAYLRYTSTHRDPRMVWVCQVMKDMTGLDNGGLVSLLHSMHIPTSRGGGLLDSTENMMMVLTADLGNFFDGCNLNGPELQMFAEGLLRIFAHGRMSPLWFRTSRTYHGSRMLLVYNEQYVGVVALWGLPSNE